MHSRDISQEEFDLIESELVRVKRLPGTIDVVAGYHEDHRFTVLIRDGTWYEAIVEEAAILDVMQTRGNVIAAEAILERTMQNRTSH